MIEKLKELKKRSGMTYNQIAEKSGVPITTITRIFNGSTQNPTMMSFMMIVRAMGGTADEVFSEEFEDGSIRINLDPEIPEVLELRKSEVAEIADNVELRTESEVAKNEAPQSHMNWEKCPYHLEMEQTYQKIISYRTKWQTAFAIALGASWLIFFGVVIYDLFNPGIGFIRAGM